MYRGRRRILVNGALSEPVVATSGIPAGCGLAVDLLHAFLQHQLNASELKVSVRKYCFTRNYYISNSKELKT
eukprot:6488536-Amphidinium_carterae.1